MRTSRSHFMAFALLLALPHLALAADWDLIRTQGMTHMAAVSKTKEASEATYRDAIRALCKPGQHCYVMIWSDRKQVPAKLPMTDAQSAAQVASYTKNPVTGFEELLWNCRLRNDPKMCFR